MTKVWTLLLPTLHSLSMKGWSEMPQRTKLPEILPTLFLTQKEWSVESLMTKTSKVILSYGHSKWLAEAYLTINLWLKCNTWIKFKDFKLNKYHQWYWLKWKKLRRLILRDRYLKQSLQFLLILMILRGRQPKMLE